MNHTIEKHIATIDSTEAGLSTRREHRTSKPAARSKAPLSNGWLMVLVCGLTLAAVLAIASLGDGRFGYAAFFVLLLCPLMHVFMHRRQGRQS